MPPRRGLLAASLLLLAAPATSHAAGWISPAATLSNLQGGTPQTAVIASNARGDTAVAWLDAASGTVFEAERPVGGVFTSGTAVLASPADQVLGTIQLDGAGNVYVFFVTEQTNPNASRTRVATKVIGAAGWAVSTLGNASNADPPQGPIAGAVNAAGKGVVVWFQAHSNNSLQSRWEFATKEAGSATWSAKADLPAPQGNALQSPSLAVNASGQAAFVYMKQFCPQVMGATMSAANTWTTAALAQAAGCVAPTGTLNYPPAVGLDDSGKATLAWSRNDGANFVTQFSTTTVGTAFPVAPASPGANDLTVTGADASAPALGVAPGGTTTVAWARGGAIQERTRAAAGGTFAAATTIPNTLTSPTAPVLATNASGAQVVLWSGTNATAHSAIGAAVRAPGVAFVSAPAAPGADNTTPAVAIDDQGNAAGGWTHTSSGPQYSVEASGLDVAGPTISAVTFPATATPGAGFTYGATLTDRWSGASGSWAFGDGTTGPLTGTKAYATDGSFNATLTATDGAGNTTTANRTIVVGTGAAPGGGPGGDPAGGAGGAPGGGPGGGVAADTIAPVFLAASMTRTRFRVDPKGRAETPATAAAKKGTAFRFTLSEAARVTITIQRIAAGRKVGTACRKPTRANHRRKACRRLVRTGAFVQNAAAGATTKPFSGRIGTKRLAPGSYQATLVARDAARNASVPKVLRFKIVRK